MPDIELLLQEWPQEFEKLLKKVTLPPPDLDCDLKTYVDLICSECFNFIERKSCSL